MHLRQIAIEASRTALIPSEPVFRWTAHHVKEVFLALLPRRFILDGSGKVQITCGPRGNDIQYQQLLGTTNYYREEFAFQEYYAASPPEREEILLKTIEDALFDITLRAG